MAGEWLKFESCLPEKPETLAITHTMGWDDPDLTVGKLMRLFRWFDQQTVDGNAVRVTPAQLDRIVGATGFVDAVAKEGWIVVDENSISLHNFDRHNGASAKARALNAKRAAAFKAKAAAYGSGNAATVSELVPKEEKRRVETPGAKAPDGEPSSTVAMTKDELWSAGKSLLMQAKMPAKQCGTFVGKLCKDFGDAAVIEAVRCAVVERPADPASWLVARCQLLTGGRPRSGKQAVPHDVWDQAINRMTQNQPPGDQDHGQQYPDAIDVDATIID